MSRESCRVQQIKRRTCWGGMVCSGQPPHSAWCGQMGCAASGASRNSSCFSASIKDALRRATRATTRWPGSACATKTTAPRPLASVGQGVRNAAPVVREREDINSNKRGGGIHGDQQIAAGRPPCKGTKINLQKTIAVSSGVVYSRPSRKSRTVWRVLQNILQNALDICRPVGQICLSLFGG